MKVFLSVTLIAEQTTNYADGLVAFGIFFGFAACIWAFGTWFR